MFKWSFVNCFVFHISWSQEGLFVVYATITDIVTGTWWYTSCVCSKAVFPDSDMYFCEKCYKHVMKVVPRYLFVFYFICFYSIWSNMLICWCWSHNIITYLIYLFIFPCFMFSNKRYCIKVCVGDVTGDTVFVIFDNVGRVLLNRTAAELFEAEDKVVYSQLFFTCILQVLFF